MEPIMPASGSANIVPGPRLQTGRPDKLDNVPETMFHLQSHLANAGVSGMGKLSSHRSRIFRAGPHANAHEEKRGKPMQSKTETEQSSVFPAQDDRSQKSCAQRRNPHCTRIENTHCTTRGLTPCWKDRLRMHSSSLNVRRGTLKVYMTVIKVCAVFESDQFGGPHAFWRPPDVFRV